MSVEGFLCDLWCRVGELTFTFALDICWKQCENICKLNIYIDIGYILPTLGGHMSVGGFMCALRAQDWGNYFELYIFIMDKVCQLLGNTYGSVSAGREKCPFNIIFFLKVERSCGQS